MTHPEQTRLFQSALDLMPSTTRGRRVLEFGSYNVNGTLRDLFDDCEYVGVDWRPGPGVDVVSRADQYQWPEQFDVFVTANMIEHDPHWEASILNGLAHLKRGGLALIHTRTPDAPPHEVGVAPDGHHYEGVSAAELVRVCEPLLRIEAWVEESRAQDAFLWGTKK